jgi:hypothetical protein
VRLAWVVALVACSPPPPAASRAPDAAPAPSGWSIRLALEPRADGPAAVWPPVLDGAEVVVASTRVGTVRVDRASGKVRSVSHRLPETAPLRPQGPDAELLLGSAGAVGEVRSVDDELVGPGWRLGRFAWCRGAIAARGDAVLAWQLDAGSIRRVVVRDGVVTERAPDAVAGDRALAAAFADDGSAILVTDRAAHRFDRDGRRLATTPLPAPETEVRVLPTAATLAGDEAYVLLEGRILLRLSTP